MSSHKSGHGGFSRVLVFSCISYSFVYKMGKVSTQDLADILLVLTASNPKCVESLRAAAPNPSKRCCKIRKQQRTQTVGSVVGPTIAPFSSTLFINARLLTHSPSLLASLPSSPALYLFFAVSSSSDSFHSNISPQLAPQLTFRGFFGQTLGACSSLGEWSGGHQGHK